MRYVLATAFVVALAGGADAATLPLRDGVYSNSTCTNSQSDIDTSIFVLAKRDRATTAAPFISPDAEGGMGNCAIRKIKMSGKNYSGVAPCTAGNREIPSGNYRFNFEVVDRQTFISKGKTYRWCAEHR